MCAFDTEPFYGGANWSRSLAHVELANRPDETPEWVKFMEFAKALGCEGDFTPEFKIRDEDLTWARDQWRVLSPPAGRLRFS